MSDHAAESHDEASSGGGGKKKLIIIIAAVLLLGGGGAGAYFMGLFGGKASEEEAAAEGEEGHGEEEGGHGDSAKEGDHESAKDEGHGDAKEGEHGDKKEEEGGGHGDEAKEEEGGHGGGEKKAEGGHGGGKAAPATVTSDGTVFYPLPPFVVNLESDGNRARFLKMDVVLELPDEEAQKKLQEMEPRVIDTFNTYLRELRPDDLAGSAGVYRLREELLLRLNKTLHPAKVNDILFKEMIVQ
jgi:flagellar FliL protein